MVKVYPGDKFSLFLWNLDSNQTFEFEVPQKSKIVSNLSELSPDTILFSTQIEIYKVTVGKK